MKIEIAEPGRMTQSGSSLLRLIQNNKTPVLDLLVRESLQNSLDAHKKDARSVTVEYRTGEFSSDKLGNELEGITDALSKRFRKDKCNYIAVCDSDTVGLTGEMDVQNVRDNNYGNLLKLVYEICKPQEAEGAGGSWGLGKTVYFRIGIGIVIYYSRIYEGNGKYSSRLAASFVENETAPDAMIPEYKGMTRRGIAWWGETIRENTTIPVTDEEYIGKFLAIFGMKPYEGEKTGTTIIIPYIDRDALLANNRIDYTDVLDEHLSPYWYKSLESYLRISAQRWYAPRLNNSDYPYGAFLKVIINGDGIAADDMEPVFKVVQALYNKANHVGVEGDILDNNKLDTLVESTRITKYLKDQNAGNIACTKVTRDILQMNAPHNKPEPPVYFNCEVTDKNSNRPLVFFVRKPGMIVSYENISAWTAGIPSTNKNEYIFGAFVLNSLNSFKTDDSPIESLEEYVRKSEMADHTSWDDWSATNFNPRIISKIQKSVTRTIGGKYAAEDVENKTKENSELSRYLGDLILPPDGFGKAASGGTGKTGGSPGIKKEKKFSFSVIQDGIKYYADSMMIPVELKTASSKKIKHTAFEMQIASETGKISVHEWEQLNLAAPFGIDNILISIDMFDGAREGTRITVSKNNLAETFNGVKFSLKITAGGVAYGVDITAEEEHSMKVRFATLVKLKEKNVRPVFVFEKEGK